MVGTDAPVHRSQPVCAQQGKAYQQVIESLVRADMTEFECPRCGDLAWVYPADVLTYLPAYLPTYEFND